MKISCLLSLYKSESASFLNKSLESIKNQTLKADEVILVEDGALTIELNNVLDQYEKKIPLKRIKLKKNVGLGKALNVGLKACSNEIILRMDTDDICFPERFEEQLKVFKNDTNLDIVGTWSNDIDEEGNFIKLRKVPTDDDKIKKIIWSNPIIHPSVAFKKSSIVAIGSYNEDLRKRQDYDLWFRAAKNNLNFYNIPKPLLNYRFTDLYYSKNSFDIALIHTKIGLKGLLSLKSKSVVGYIGVTIPLIRSLLPKYLSKNFHKLMNVFDPRKMS